MNEGKKDCTEEYAQIECVGECMENTCVTNTVSLVNFSFSIWICTPYVQAKLLFLCSELLLLRKMRIKHLHYRCHVGR